MSFEDYSETFKQLVHKRTVLVQKRTELETQLNDLNVEIAHLEEVTDHLGPLAGIVADPASIVGLGITDAIRTVLRTSQTRMAASDVRRELGEKGFDFSGQTHPMASIYKILSRLYEAGEIDKIEDEDNFRVFYAWKKDDEIKDEDIPF